MTIDEPVRAPVALDPVEVAGGGLQSAPPTGRRKRGLRKRDERRAPRHQLGLDTDAVASLEWHPVPLDRLDPSVSTTPHPDRQAARALREQVESLTAALGDAERSARESRREAERAAAARSELTRLLEAMAQQAGEAHEAMVTAGTSASEAAATARENAELARSFLEAWDNRLGEAEARWQQAVEQLDERAATSTAMLQRAHDLATHVERSRHELLAVVGEVRETASGAEEAYRSAETSHRGAEQQADQRARAESQLAEALEARLLDQQKVSEAQESLLRSTLERSDAEAAASRVVAELRADLDAARASATESSRARREAELCLVETQERLAETERRLDDALGASERQAQQLTQALRSATVAGENAREAQQRRLEAEMAATRSAESAQDAQVAASRALDDQRSAHEEAARSGEGLTTLLSEADAALSQALQRLAQHGEMLAAARDQVLVQAAERIRTEEANRTTLLRRLSRPRAGSAHLVPPPGTVGASSAPSDAGERVAWPSAGAVQTVVVLAAALVAAIIAGLAGWSVATDPGPAKVAVTLLALAAAAGLVRHWWLLRAAADVELVGSVLHIHRNGSHHAFDLADPRTDVEVSGNPGSREWRASFHRRGLAPVVLDAWDMPPADLADELRRWRGTLVV